MWNIDADPGYRDIPERIMGAMFRWGKEGIVPGSFVCAVMRNDLLDAVSLADNEVIHHLPAIVRFVHNQMPGGCHGNGQSVITTWRKRLEVINDE